MIRCPECSTEIDVDEDEVEEGEILSCPECESELEVSQTHPVHLNLISDDLDDEEEDDDEEEAAENGDLPRFYARVKALAALAPAERDAALSAVALK